MDPFHLIQLAGDALDPCRKRDQQETTGHRGQAGDPLFAARLTLHSGEALLTDQGWHRLRVLFTGDEHVQVEATWGVFQRIISAYRDPDPAAGRRAPRHVIDTLAAGIPAGLDEPHRLGTTLKRRAGDILAWFDHPRSSNGPTEAINGRLEHLRGITLGFRNITNYIARSRLETGEFKPNLHRQL
jgi:transposase